MLAPHFDIDTFGSVRDRRLTVPLDYFCPSVYSSRSRLAFCFLAVCPAPVTSRILSSHVKIGANFLGTFSLRTGFRSLCCVDILTYFYTLSQLLTEPASAEHLIVAALVVVLSLLTASGYRNARTISLGASEQKVRFYTMLRVFILLTRNIFMPLTASDYNSVFCEYLSYAFISDNPIVYIFLSWIDAYLVWVGISFWVRVAQRRRGSRSIEV